MWTLWGFGGAVHQGLSRGFASLPSGSDYPIGEAGATSLANQQRRMIVNGSLVWSLEYTEEAARGESQPIVCM